MLTNRARKHAGSFDAPGRIKRIARSIFLEGRLNGLRPDRSGGVVTGLVASKAVDERKCYRWMVRRTNADDNDDIGYNLKSLNGHGFGALPDEGKLAV